MTATNTIDLFFGPCFVRVRASGDRGMRLIETTMTIVVLGTAFYFLR